MTDTIFALATAPGLAGIAVLRLSGRDAGSALERLAGSLPEPRRVALRRFRDPCTGETIDTGLALWLPGPASYTGEDMAELQVHGGRAVPGALLKALGAIPGLRLAEPGEFTRRAFENGKLDLTEAEAIADLVHAETEAQRRQAQRQLAGELGRLYESWRARLLTLLAHWEAAIDFPDEVADEAGLEVAGELSRLREEIAAHLADGRRGERLREGLSVAIVGPPNAGKSSLLNWLARRDAAIVSASAGTTRDVVEVHLDLGGYPVTLADTAGLRGAADEVEAEGIRRALDRAAAADLRIVVLDASGGEPLTEPLKGQLGPDAIVIANKSDLVPSSRELTPPAELAVSVRTGAGMPALLERLENEVRNRLGGGSGGPVLTRARHRHALEECLASLERALSSLGERALPELLAEDLRLAVRNLGRITGKVDVETMLDIVFREFCIGK